MKIALVAACLALAIAAPVSAQGDVMLTCDGACAALDLARVRDRVGEETGTVVHLSLPDGGARGETLTVRVEGDVRVVLLLSRGDGTRLERAAELPPEGNERTETLAILVVNMLRDEASELLALLRPPVAEPAVAPEPVAVIAVSETPADDTSEPAQPVAPDDGTLPALPPPAPPRDPFLRLGLATHLGSVSRGTGYETDFLAGAEIAWTPLPFFAVGAREIGAGGDLDTSAIHAGAAPFVELGLVLSFVTLYADLGAHVQLVFDDGVQGLAGVGVAPLLTAGVRFRLAREVSLGIETTVHVVATDAFYTSLHRLPQLAVPWTGGLSLLFHVS